MNKSEITPLIDSLIPQLYNFAYSLIPDELQAEQLVVDAYSVFLVREQAFLLDCHYDKDPKKRSKVKKKIQNLLITDLLELGSKRAPQLKELLRSERKHKAFYQLEINQRAVLSLKENLNLSLSELQEVFALQRHQVIELLHNARAAVTGASETIEEVESECLR